MSKFPKKVQAVLSSFNEDMDGYKECQRIVDELEQIGWTAEFYLDAELFNIRRKKK